MPVVRRVLVAAATLPLLALTAPTGAAAATIPATGRAAEQESADAPSLEAHRPARGALFSSRGSGIKNVILANVAHAPRGSTIRATTMSFSDTDYTGALLAAHRRGVNVRLLADGKKTKGVAAMTKLRQGLKQTSGGDSWARRTRWSARGPKWTYGERTQMHQKSWTFSRTGSARKVSIVTSLNLTTEAVTRQHNDGYAWVGDSGIYDALTRVFAEQAKDRPVTNPYRLLADRRLAFSPWDPGQLDPVVSRIRAVPGNARVRIAMAAWHGKRGEAIARALVAAKKRGAKIQIVAGRPTSNPVRAILRPHFRLHEGYSSETNYVHTKFMTATWSTGAGRVTRVWTGSENWTGGRTTGNDELTAEIRLPGPHDSWVRYFKALKRI